MARQFRRGDYIPIVVQVVDSKGVPVNLTDTTVKLKMGQDPKSPAYLTKTLTVTDAAGGVAEGELLPSETSQMVGTWYWTLTRTPASDGIERIIATGAVQFSNIVG